MHGLGSRGPAGAGDTWWRSAAIYQLYVRSFADGNGDGIGDLAGVRARLGYLAASGSTRSGSTRGTRRQCPTPDTTSPTTAPSIPPSARWRTLSADRRGARARHQDDHRHRPEPRLRPAPVVPGGARRRPARPSEPGSGSGPAAARAASCRRTAGSPSSAGPPGPGSPSRTARPASGTCTCSLPTAGLQLGQPGGPGRVRGRPAVLVRPRRGRHADRLGRAADQGPAAARDRADELPGPAHPFTDRDDVHDIYRSWRAVAGRVRRPGPDRRGLAPRRRPPGPVPQPGRAAHRVQLPLPGCPWDAAQLREVIDSTLALNAPAGAPATWVLSNHDVDRHRVPVRSCRHRFQPAAAARISRPPRRSGARHPAGARGGPAHAGAARLGLRLSGRGARPLGSPGHPGRAAAGPDLGGPAGADPGRDGSRVPLPWSGAEPPFGFAAGPERSRSRGSRSPRTGAT